MGVGRRGPYEWTNLDELVTSLVLPPSLEEKPAEIEAGLPTLDIPSVES